MTSMLTEKLFYSYRQRCYGLLLCMAFLTTPAQADPVAIIGGPYSGFRNTSIQLSGSGSYDTLGLPLTYGWDFNADGFTDSTEINPTISFDRFPGIYVVELTVFESPGGVSASAFTTIQIQNRNPVASAGGPYMATVGIPVFLNGSASYDPDGEALFFSWDLNNAGLFNDSTLENPSFTFEVSGPHSVSLRAADFTGGVSIASSVVYVAVIPPRSTVSEPSTVTMAVIGLAALVARRKKWLRKC